MISLKTILVPIDFSTGSVQALQEAATLASQFHARLVLLHVLPLLEMKQLVSEIRDTHPVDLLYQQYEGRVEEFYREVVSAATRRDLTAIPLFVPGDPTEEIVWQALAHKADLIVMATHGRTGLSRLFHGSVAEKVVRRASCPVLTLKPLPARRGDTGYREAA